MRWFLTKSGNPHLVLPIMVVAKPTQFSLQLRLLLTDLFEIITKQLGILRFHLKNEHFCKSSAVASLSITSCSRGLSFSFSWKLPSLSISVLQHTTILGQPLTVTVSLLYIGNAVCVFRRSPSVKWSKPHWMTYCTWDNLLLCPCLNGCNLKVSSSRDGWVGSMFVSISRWKGVGCGLIKYHNWSIPRVSSSRKRAGQGLSSSEQEHFFCTKVIIKAQLLIQFAMDGCYQKSQGCFSFVFIL